MKITIGNMQALLSKDTVIAQGGEAVIHSDPNFPDSHVLKIYHSYDRKREQKVRHILKGGIEFPKHACLPISLVTDERNKFLGFQMRRLSTHFQRSRRMFSKQFNYDHGFTTKVKTDIFCQIGADLQKIHANGTVVGDMNDANIMVNENDYDIGWVDVDSWSIGKFPCVVGTELYLSPDLYGLDLSNHAPFEPKHDWWSFCVLFLRALLNGVHVFKSGTHPHFQSILERAREGITVFDKDVAYPSIGFPPEVLSDDILNICIPILKRKEVKPFPLDALKHYGEILVGCASCKTWYPASRPHCPSCAHKTMLDMEMMAKVAGFDVTTLIETQERILYHQLSGSTIFVVAEESGEVVVYRKKQGSSPIRIPLGVHSVPGALYGFFNDVLVTCPNPADEEADLYLLEIDEKNSVNPIKALTTGGFAGGRAVFALSSRFLYRTAGNILLLSSRFGKRNIVERQVMQIFQGQTWFTAVHNPGDDQEILAGFHREFRNMNWFFIRGDAEGKRFIRFDMSIPQLENRETLLDLALRFTPEFLLISRKTRKIGVDHVRLEMVSLKDGSVTLSRLTALSGADHWDSVQGKAFSNGFVMHPTDRGIIREKLDDGTTSELALTAKYITAVDSLERYGMGVLVVKDDKMILIERK